MISLDTETTGVDFRHGARPFLVTTCDQNGYVRFWEWNVDPLTRGPVIPDGDLAAVRALILSPRAADGLVLHNTKFDFHALEALGLDPDPWWPRVRDTLLAAHLLASNRPKNLTDLAVQWLGVDIQPLEDRLGEAVQTCRRMVRGKPWQADHGVWAIASADRPDMPSAKEKTWKFDLWLPRAVAKALGYPEPDDNCPVVNGKQHDWDGAWGHNPRCRRCGGHGWWVACRLYANADSEVTAALWRVLWGEVQRRRLDKLYAERLKVLRVTWEMERNGATGSKARQDDLEGRFTDDSRECGRICVAVAAGLGHDLVLPVNGVNNNLRTFCFDVLRLEPLRNPKARTDAPTLDKSAIEHYTATLPQDSPARTFVEALVRKRARDTALGFLDGYKRFRLEYPGVGPLKDTWVLYPSFNVTGTDTLRFSGSNPNLQQVSGKEEVNIREAFGPAPGREWWGLDARGIEDRLPAYKSGQKELIAIFEDPDSPPYYGSNHLLRFHTVYPDVWDKELREVGFDKVGPYCKEKYKATYYKWVKNGGFAVQYGAVDLPGGWGTADKAFHKQGAHRLLKERFSALEALNRRYIEFANRHGYVETFPDRTVDPERGYPLLCSRTDYGRVLETVPMNYVIQGSAMWWTGKAMIRTAEALSQWNREGFTARMVMQVHDEIVFDLPAGPDPRTNPGASNLDRVRELARLMGLGGSLDYGIPTPVGIEYHPRHWAEGFAFSA